MVRQVCHYLGKKGGSKIQVANSPFGKGAATAGDPRSVALLGKIGFSCHAAYYIDVFSPALERIATDSTCLDSKILIAYGACQRKGGAVGQHHIDDSLKSIRTCGTPFTGDQALPPALVC